MTTYLPGSSCYHVGLSRPVAHFGDPPKLALSGSDYVAGLIAHPTVISTDTVQRFKMWRNARLGEYLRWATWVEAGQVVLR